MGDSGMTMAAVDGERKPALQVVVLVSDSAEDDVHEFGPRCGGARMRCLLWPFLSTGFPLVLLL